LLNLNAANFGKNGGRAGTSTTGDATGGKSLCIFSLTVFSAKLKYLQTSYQATEEASSTTPTLLLLPCPLSSTTTLLPPPNTTLLPPWNTTPLLLWRTLTLVLLPVLSSSLKKSVSDLLMGAMLSR